MTFKADYSSKTGYEYTNLLTNFGARSPRADLNPFIGFGVKSDYYSCWEADVSTNPAGKPFEVTFGFETPFFVTSVILVQNTDTDYLGEQNKTLLDTWYAALWDIYIGDDPNWQNN